MSLSKVKFFVNLLVEVDVEDWDDAEKLKEAIIDTLGEDGFRVIWSKASEADK